MTESKRFDTPLEAWSQFQEQMWGNWLRTTQFNPNILRNQLFNKQLGLMEELVNCSLRAQSDWVSSYTKADWESSYTRGLGDETGASKVMAQWAEQNMAAAKMWTDSQKQYWGIWFNALKALEPIHHADKGTDLADHVFQSFQDVTKKTWEMQSEWLSNWLPNEESAQPKTAQKKRPVQNLSQDKKQAKSAA